MTQEVLAGTADVSVRWLSKVENGQVASPRMDYLGRVADALGLKVTDLVSGEVGRLRARPPVPKVESATRRREAAVRGRIEQLSTRWGTVIGGVWFPWVVAGYGPYRPEHIESYYTAEEPVYPDEIEEAYRLLHEDVGRRAVLGEEVPYNSAGYKLVRFHVSSRAGSQEEPKLVLHFAPTDFFRMLVTDQRLDVPLTAGGRTYTLRERYAAEVDLRIAPVPELATHWGVGLGVVTADGRLLVSERGNTAVDPHVYFPAVAEGATRPLDVTGTGAPDHFNTARRGVLEELGVDVKAEELTWLSFGANSYLCEYALIGKIDTAHTFAEIESHRSVGAAKDSWETKRLHAVEFSPPAVSRFCSEPDRRFSAFALITIVHSLMHEFGVSKTAAAFENASVNVTQHLPQWLVREPVDKRLSATGAVVVAGHGASRAGVRSRRTRPHPGAW